MSKGGARPGSGRKPGGKNKETLEREKVLAALRQRIMQKADQILNAQFTLANGMTFLYRIEKDSEGKNQKAELVLDPEEIKTFLDEYADFGSGTIDDSYYYITTIKPDPQVLDSMLNRAFGKPTEHVEHTGADGEPLELAIQMVRR